RPPPEDHSVAGQRTRTEEAREVGGVDRARPTEAIRNQCATRALPVSLLSVFGRLVMRWTISLVKSPSSPPAASALAVYLKPRPRPTPATVGARELGSWLFACEISAQSSSFDRCRAARKAPSSSRAAPAPSRARRTSVASTPPSCIA